MAHSESVVAAVAEGCHLPVFPVLIWYSYFRSTFAEVARDETAVNTWSDKDVRIIGRRTYHSNGHCPTP